MLIARHNAAHTKALAQPCWHVQQVVAAVPKPQHRQRLHVLCQVTVKAAKTVTVPNPQGPGYQAFQAELQLPAAGTSVYQVSLQKPLGLTLTEQSGAIVVDELVPGGHAAAAGVMQGDVLLATTARAQSSTPGSTQVVLIKTAGESFKTVTAALRSNTCAQCNINLVLQRPVEQQ